MTSTSVIGTTFFGLDVSRLRDSLQLFGRRISRSTLLIEFAPGMLQIAEAKPRSHGIEIKHLSRIALPDGALDRAIPADPALMAQLLLELCKEKQIVSHRAAVVLPTELAFQRMIKLPQSLSVADARSFLLDPNNGVALPFPLAQTDFDLTPMQLQSDSADQQNTYQLTAVPDTFVDPIISMLELSGFELQKLELGVFSTLRCIKHEVMKLSRMEVCFILDFSSESTLVTMVGSSGPIDSERLATTREFPRFELSANESDQIIERSKSLEELTIENDRYLPVSEMDLRAFFRDFKNVMAGFLQRFPGLKPSKIYLTGDGSAHPDLPALLQNKLNLPVKQIRPLLADRIRDWSVDEPLLLVGLSRLVGLGLSLLPHDSRIEVSDVRDNAKINSHHMTELLIKTVNSESYGMITDQLLLQTAERDSSSEPLSVGRSDTSSNAHATGVALEAVVADDESEWPSLKLDDVQNSSGQEIEEENVIVEADVSVESAEDVVADDESEWPSLKLDDLQDSVGQEIVRDNDLAEADVTVESRVEVVEEDRTQPLLLKLQQVEDSLLISEGDEDCETQPLQMSELIPGLPIHRSAQDQDKAVNEAKKITDSDPITGNDSPLGDLKFKAD